MRFLCLLTLVVPLIFSACSSHPAARMTEWQNSDFTVCCLKQECSDKDWVQSAARYCKGSIRMVGGKMTEGVTGYETEKGKGNTFRLNPTMGVKSCRTFTCDGTIIPPK